MPGAAGRRTAWRGMRGRRRAPGRRGDPPGEPCRARSSTWPSASWPAGTRTRPWPRPGPRATASDGRGARWRPHGRSWWCSRPGGGPAPRGCARRVAPSGWPSGSRRRGPRTPPSRGCSPAGRRPTPGGTTRRSCGRRPPATAATRPGWCGPLRGSPRHSTGTSETSCEGCGTPAAEAWTRSTTTGPRWAAPSCGRWLRRAATSWPGWRRPARSTPARGRSCGGASGGGERWPSLRPGPRATGSWPVFWPRCVPTIVGCPRPGPATSRPACWSASEPGWRSPSSTAGAWSASRTARGRPSAGVDVDRLVDEVGDATFVELFEVDGRLRSVVVTGGRVRAYAVGQRRGRRRGGRLGAVRAAAGGAWPAGPARRHPGSPPDSVARPVRRRLRHGTGRGLADRLAARHPVGTAARAGGRTRHGRAHGVGLAARPWIKDSPARSGARCRSGAGIGGSGGPPGGRAASGRRGAERRVRHRRGMPARHGRRRARARGCARQVPRRQPHVLGTRAGRRTADRPRLRAAPARAAPVRAVRVRLGRAGPRRRQRAPRAGHGSDVDGYGGHPLHASRRSTTRPRSS